MRSDTTSLAADFASPTSVAATWALAVSGDLDIVAAPALRQSLAWAGRQQVAQVVVDLSAVTFIDCAGVRPLLEAKTRLGARMHVADPSARVTWFLELAGLRGVLDRMPAPAPPRPDYGLAPSPSQGPDFDNLTALEIAFADLQIGLRELAVIERAKGVVMGARGCSQREAWVALVQAAQMHNVPVRDIAAALTATAAGRSDCPPGPATAAALRSLAPPSTPGHGAPPSVPVSGGALTRTGRQPRARLGRPASH